MRERFALDVWYVDHWSIGLDLRILGLTLRRFVVRDHQALSCAVDPWFDAFASSGPGSGATAPTAASTPGEGSA